MNNAAILSLLLVLVRYSTPKAEYEDQYVAVLDEIRKLLTEEQ